MARISSLSVRVVDVGGLVSRRKRRQAQAERIAELEEWHRSFDEFKDEGYDVAAEMAKGGVSYLSYLLKWRYLPVISEYLTSE